jgi:NTP pyrophosphatase (non-canonical NTP hydrolase)
VGPADLPHTLLHRVNCDMATSDPLAAGQARWRPNLAGPSRLIEVVRELSGGCVWTQSITPIDMLHALRSECDEVELELARLPAPANATAVGSNGTHIREDAASASATRNEDTSELVSELGDVLFDALMVHAVFSRVYGLDPDAAWNAACRKVEGRTPYMPWGDGSARADTVAEAEAHWQEAKRREKLSLTTTSGLQTVSSEHPVETERGLRPSGPREAACCTPASTSTSPTGSISFTSLGIGFALGVAAAVACRRCL